MTVVAILGLAWDLLLLGRFSYPSSQLRVQWVRLPPRTRLPRNNLNRVDEDTIPGRPYIHQVFFR